MRPELEPVARDPARSAILLDFDGTLSDIVARPELARPAEGVRETLAALAERYALVAVVSGRSTSEVRDLVGVPGVRYAGHYGSEAPGASLAPSLREATAAAARAVEGAWVDDKGSSLAVHYRQAPDPVAAASQLEGSLRALAREHGLEVVEGKMVLELVPRGRPRKGAAVERLVRESGARAVLFAGDDLADLEAFEAMDRLRAKGVHAVKVAVRGAEERPELIRAADLVVESPSALAALLGDLAAGPA